MVKNDNSVVGLVNGSMAVAKKAAKVKNITRSRHFLEARASDNSFAQVLSETQSPFRLGSQFETTTLLFYASKLSDNAVEWIQKHDKYRISKVEVFASYILENQDGSVANDHVEVYFYEDTDADPGTQTSWIRLRDRENVGRVVLTPQAPSQRLITFKPTPTFAAGSGIQSTQNQVPSKNMWLDAVAVEQRYSGLRVFAACPRADASGNTYRCTVNYLTRYHVEASQPI
jgi:hypothetical protein